MTQVRCQGRERVSENSQNLLKWGEYSEFVSGFGAGVSNICITFPLNKLIFRQMLNGLSPTQAFAQLKKEGPFLLYRGILPPLCQKSASMAIMFGTYDYYSKVSSLSFPNTPHTQLVKSCSAGLAGLTEAILTPFERVQTLLQDRHYNTKFTNSMHAVRYIWSTHGIREFYRGYFMIVFRNSTSNIIFFAAREHARNLFPETHTLWTNYVLNFVCGGLIGAMISTAFYPVNLVKARMQSRIGGPFQHPFVVFKIIFNERDRSWRKLFRGVHLNYTRSLLSWGITNASYELFKNLFHPETGIS